MASTGSLSAGQRGGEGTGGRKGLGWLPWALLAAGIIALAIFLLLRNAGDDGDDSGIDTTDERSDGANEDADVGEGGGDTASEVTDGGDGTGGDGSSASEGASGGSDDASEDDAAAGSGSGSGAGQSGSSGSSGSAGSTGAGSSPLVADGQPLLPLPAGGLAPFSGSPAEATSAPVQSVVSDEGFWVGTSETDRAFVRLVTNGQESPVQVEAGRPISFTGTVKPNPADVADLGVTAEEGAPLLEQQGHHIEVPLAELRQG